MSCDGHYLRFLKVGSRPLIAFGGDVSLYGELARLMDASTPKRSLVRNIARTLVSTHLVSGFTTPIRSRDVPGLHQVLDSISRAGTGAAAWSVTWPPGSDRSQRRYVLVLDEDGRSILFAKITTDLAADGSLFEREYRLLQHLDETPLRKWRVPKAFKLVRSHGACAMLLEPLPAVREALAWSEVRAGLPVAPVRIARATSPSWIEPGLALPMSRSFERVVRHRLQSPLAVGMVNGDIRPQNAVMAGQQRWMFDWEMGSLEGPAACDAVVSQLNEFVSARPHQPDRTVRDNLLSWTQAQALDPEDLCMVLLYLGTVDHHWARRLMLLEWPVDIEVGERFS